MAPAQWTRAREAARPTWLAPVACVLLALALRAPYAGTALGSDEGGIAFIARQWPGGHGSLYGAYWLDRPPLLVGLFKLAEPGGDAGVRALGAAAAIALVLAVWRLGAEVAGEEARPDRRAAGGAADRLGRDRRRLHAGGAARGGAAGSTLSVLCARLRRRLFAAGLLAVAAADDQAVVPRRGRGRARVPDREQRRAPAAAPLGSSTRRARYPGGAVLAGRGTLARASSTRCSASASRRCTRWRLGRPAHDPPRAAAAPAPRPALVVASSPRCRGCGAAGDRVLAVTLAAWFAGAAVGVLGGGSYWPHYLIELVPVSVLAAAALSPSRRWPRRRRLTALAVVGRRRRHEQRARYHATASRSRATCATTRGPATRSTSCTRGRTSSTTPGCPSPTPTRGACSSGPSPARPPPPAAARVAAAADVDRRWQRPGRWGLDPGGATRGSPAHYGWSPTSPATRSTRGLSGRRGTSRRRVRRGGPWVKPRAITPDSRCSPWRAGDRLRRHRDEPAVRAADGVRRRPHAVRRPGGRLRRRLARLLGDHDDRLGQVRRADHARRQRGRGRDHGADRADPRRRAAAALRARSRWSRWASSAPRCSTATA